MAIAETTTSTPVGITRAVSPRLAAGERSRLGSEPIDIDLAVRQHAGYEAALRAGGYRVVRATAAPDRPDAVFIEDTAVVLDEVAVLTRPGAATRRSEVDDVEPLLSAYRPVVRLGEPARVDGGDVLVLGRRLYVGASARTDAAGAAALAAAVATYGYDVVVVPVRGALHLKTAAGRVAGSTVLVNAAWVDPAGFLGADTIVVPAEEPFAANVVSLPGALLLPAGNPRTAELLRGRGYPVRELDISELQKAEAGLSCLSLLVG